MNTFTPGPWSIVGATLVWKTGPAGAAVAMIAEPDVETSSDFRRVEVGSKRFEEACANASLIAAAPELLDALRAFCGDYESTPFKIPEIHAAYRHALAVIAKAEGR